MMCFQSIHEEMKESTGPIYFSSTLVTSPSTMFSLYFWEDPLILYIQKMDINKQDKKGLWHTVYLTFATELEFDYTNLFI